LAVNLLSLTAVFIFLSAGLVWGYSQFVVVDAARSAARMLARGEQPADITGSINSKYPQVNLTISANDYLATATASIAPWSPPVIPTHLLPNIEASATADTEGWATYPNWASQ
jgi:hypothetical protein